MTVDRQPVTHRPIMPRFRGENGDDAPRREAIRRGRREKEKVLGAREILRRCAWLDHHLVFWSGQAEQTNCERLAGFRPVTTLIINRLQRRPAGIYSVGLNYDLPAASGEIRTSQLAKRINPLVTSAKLVTGKLIATTTYALQAAKRYPKALPKLVSEPVDTWCARRISQLKSVGSALSALAPVNQSDLSAFTLDESCWMLGAQNGGRGQLLKLLLRDGALETATSPHEPGIRCAAFMLGQLGMPQPHPDPTLNALGRLGKRLSHWPLQLVFRLSEPVDFERRLSRSANLRCDIINTPRMALLAEEFFFAASSKRFDLLSLLPELPDFVNSAGMAGRGASPWSMTWFGLAGRLCPVGEPGKVLSRLAVWLGHCRTNVAPEHDAAFRFAIFCLESAAGAGGWNPSGRNCMIRELSRLGKTFFQALSRDRPYKSDHPLLHNWIEFADPALRFLARLTDFDLRELDTLWNRVDLALSAAVLENNPALLPDYRQWLQDLPQSYHVAGRAWSWRCVFLLPNHTLARRILQWTRGVPLEGSPDFSWDHLARIASTFAEFHEIWIDDPDPRDTPKARQDFLLTHDCLWDEFLREIFTRVREFGSRDLADAIEAREPSLIAAYFWHLETNEDPSPLFKLVAKLVADAERSAQNNGERMVGVSYPLFESEVQIHTAVRLAGGDLSRFIPVLEACKGHDDLFSYQHSPYQGWNQLEHFTEVREALCDCVGEVELAPRIIKLLSRLCLIIRLRSDQNVAEELKAWLNPPDSHASPRQFSAAIQNVIDQISYFRNKAKHQKSVPKAIRKVLELPNSLRSEREHLLRRSKKLSLSEAETQRLEKIEERLSRPDRLCHWQEGELNRILEKHLRYARVEALEATVHSVVQHHWSQMKTETQVDLEDPDWENAILFAYTITKNRRILRRVLKERATGKTDWILRHAANRKYLEDLEARGFKQAAAWMESRELTRRVDGETWSVRTESDPIKILQMGNLFKTCLGLQGCNNFSTVANAVEVNKRVLYVRNGREQIIGRKLIFVNRQGILFGCESYGSGWDDESEFAGRPWIKILLDLLSLEIAREAGFKLADQRRQSKLEKDGDDDIAKDLAIFAKWYFDGFEEFDWWLRELSQKRTPTADRVAGMIEDSLGSSRKGRIAASLRYLLHLNDAALDLMESPSIHRALNKVPNDLLNNAARHAQCAELRTRFNAFVTD